MTDLKVSHETKALANTAAVGFMADVTAARTKWGIPDVVLLGRVVYRENGKPVEAVIECVLGDRRHFDNMIAITISHDPAMARSAAKQVLATTGA